MMDGDAFIDRGRAVKADSVPQHPLIGKGQWARLQDGRRKSLSYWATTGEHKHRTECLRVIVTKEDAP